MCHAGVEEYVFFVGSKAFVSVSGYGIDEKKASRRMRLLSNEYCIDYSQLSAVYENGLKHELEDVEQLKTIIKPLCHMLSLLNMIPFHDREIQSANKTFDSILSFVNRNYMNNITLSEIASACSCSESTVSHLFKLHTGISAQKYIINLRLKQAEKLLSTSSLPITEIAFLCGFNNSNYFSTVFKKAKGISPSDYSRSQ